MSFAEVGKNNRDYIVFSFFFLKDMDEVKSNQANIESSIENCVH